jgi:hypothetical protein
MNQQEKRRKLFDCRDPNYPGMAAEFPWLPGYLIKAGEGRVEGGEILEKCIREKQLHLLEVPQQTLYHIPQAHQHLTQLKTLCICKKVEGKQGKELLISSAHVQQLETLILATGIGDMKWRNLVHTSDGKIALIDTEIGTFWGARYGLAYLREWNTLQ